MNCSTIRTPDTVHICKHDLKIDQSQGLAGQAKELRKASPVWAFTVTDAELCVLEQYDHVEFLRLQK